MSAKRPYILLISGPAASGKSTIAREWASSREHPCAHLSLDDMREAIKTGFADPTFGWTDESKVQFIAARRSVAFAAQQFLDIGVSSVIDDVVFSEWNECDYAGWAAEFADVTPDMLILLPNIETTLSRNAGRSGNKNLPEDIVRTIHNMMQPWRNQSKYRVIDTSDMTINQTLASIETTIQES